MKKLKVQRLLAAVLTTAVTASMLAGCSDNSQNAPSAKEESKTNETDENSECADLVLKNGEIQTLTSDDDVQQAVAVRDGEIIFVGSDEDAEDYIGDKTQIINLEGSYMTPGLIDAHTHDVQAILTEMFQCYLSDKEPSIEEYQKTLKEFAEANPDMEIITGGSIDLNAFEDGVPDASWIDEIVDDRPVILKDVSLHGRCLNTKAMEELNITKDTPDPQGGKIYRDADGNPTGYFSDCQRLVSPIDTTEYTAEQYKEAFLVYQEHANSLGITGIDLGGNELAQPDEWEVLSEMAENGELNLRVNSIVWAGGSERTYNAETAAKDIKLLDNGQKFNSDFIKVTQVKVKLDGVPEGKSAVLLEPYAEGAEMGDSYYGSLNADPEKLNDYVAQINAAGYQVQIHAMGDGAVHTALNSYENSITENGEKDYRNIVTHVTLITDEDKKRMADMDIIAAMQPMWFYYDPIFSPLEEQMFGSERFAEEYHIREMMDLGIMITGSADFPITEDNPLDGIEAGVTQCSPFPEEEDSSDYVRNADQTATPMEALKWYTTNAAFQMEMEDLIGTIEVGKKADFTVMKKNLLTCDPKEINETEILYTISDGRIVFEG